MLTGRTQTISTVSHFFLAMLQHPEILRKAQEEIDTVVGTSRLPTFSDRPNLPYVEAVVNETMRIATPVPLGECFLPASCSASQRARSFLASLLVYCVVSRLAG